jgi:hypothetical protein
VNRRILAATIALSALATGCETRLNALTSPPPGAVGVYDDSEQRVELSPGVALAISCVHTSGPCSGLQVEVDDPAIAGARVAFVDDLSYSGEAQGEVPTAAFVVYATRPGTTVLRLRGDGVSEELEVVVE